MKNKAKNNNNLFNLNTIMTKCKKNKASNNNNNNKPKVANNNNNNFQDNKMLVYMVNN